MAYPRQAYQNMDKTYARMDTAYPEWQGGSMARGQYGKGPVWQDATMARGQYGKGPIWQGANMARGQYGNEPVRQYGSLIIHDH